MVIDVSVSVFSNSVGEFTRNESMSRLDKALARVCHTKEQVV